MINQSFNIYCDESCHLERDKQPVMVLGAVWCPTESVQRVATQLRNIKAANGLNPKFEIKWSKVSPGKQDFYLSIVDYFFTEQALAFRGLVVPDKSKLRHELFGQDHDTFYYKMYFQMLKPLFSTNCRYRVYLDIKDTWGRRKTIRLHEVLSSYLRDPSHSIIERIQIMRSNELEIIQLADVLVGAVSYVNRGLTTNTGKTAVVSLIQERTQHNLLLSTPYNEKKFNLFHWSPTEKRL